MKAPTVIPFWIFMTALAFPLVLIATAAIGSSSDQLGSMIQSRLNQKGEFSIKTAEPSDAHQVLGRSLDLR